MTNEPTARAKAIAKRYSMSVDDLGKNFYLVEMGAEELEQNQSGEQNSVTEMDGLKEYLAENLSAEERAALKDTKFFYEIVYEKPGGLVMPILVEFTYADGSKESKNYPAEIWRFNDKEISKAIASTSELVKITVDPDKETADIDTSNNSWPKEIKQSKFDQFKTEVKN